MLRFATALFAALVLAPLPALACSCVPPGKVDLAQFVARTAVFFWGRAVSREPGAGQMVYLFEAAGEKGALPVRVRVSTRLSSAACGARFPLNETVLVGAGRRGSTLVANACTQYVIRARRAEIVRMLRGCRPFAKCP